MFQYPYRNSLAFLKNNVLFVYIVYSLDRSASNTGLVYLLNHLMGLLTKLGYADAEYCRSFLPESKEAFVAFGCLILPTVETNTGPVEE